MSVVNAGTSNCFCALLKGRPRIRGHELMALCTSNVLRNSRLPSTTPSPFVFTHFHVRPVVVRRDRRNTSNGWFFPKLQLFSFACCICRAFFQNALSFARLFVYEGAILRTGIASCVLLAASKGGDRSWKIRSLWLGRTLIARSTHAGISGNCKRELWSSSGAGHRSSRLFGLSTRWLFGKRFETSWRKQREILS